MIYLCRIQDSPDPSAYLRRCRLLNMEKPCGKANWVSQCGWLLLRYALLREYGLDFACQTVAVTPYDKPYFTDLKEIHFNISHSRGMAAVVLDKEPVGIDIQKIMAYKESLARRICSHVEWETLSQAEDKAKTLYTFWAMKESYVKYTGLGLRCGLKTIPYLPHAVVYGAAEGYALSVCSEKKVKRQVCFVPEEALEGRTEPWNI